MAIKITELPRSKLHALAIGTEIIVRFTDYPDRTGTFMLQSNDQPAIRTEQESYPVLIDLTSRVFVIERS